LDDGLRAGLGHGKRYGIGHTGDLVRNLRTNDGSRVHHHDCRRLCARRGGTNWGLANTTGTGHSDSLQVGGYGITWFGRAYLSSVLAITNNWFTSNRSAISSPRTFSGQSYGARLEGGYTSRPLGKLKATGVIETKRAAILIADEKASS